MFNQYPYLTPGFGFGLLLVRCLLGQCRNVSLDQFELLDPDNFPWDSNDSYRVTSPSGE